MINDHHIRLIQSLLIFVTIVLSMIAISVSGKVFFSSLLWLLGEGFNTTWKDIVHGAKVGLYGGGVGGIGLGLLHFLKMKGF